MIYSAIWQIVKDSINTASDSLLFTTMWIKMTTTGIQKHTDINWCKNIARLSLVMLGNKFPNAATVTNPLHSAEKSLTTLGSEGNHITLCCLVPAALTDMWQHITRSHGRVAAVPSHPASQMLPPLSKDTWSPHESSPELPWLSAQDAESSRYLRREGWSLQWFRAGTTVRSEGSAFQDSHPSQQGEAARFSHAGFIHIHTTVTALRYCNRSSVCSYRRHCIEQFHYLISVFNHAYLIFS